ncbi:MAG: hypothetical protein GF383_15195 [Candidatus Lokiarchaeota archaeon]|nr:hypothetical protein [Candidatus Lokiarchaeota archaeon]MBD3342865.1 hypothetical protein [Candidatus Lokiarchaeota archaeon]
MPRGDGTGPGGLGPMTGRGLGYCAGYSTPGYMKGPGMGLGRGGGRGRGGRGLGWGRGFGWGRGAGYWSYPAPAYPRTVAPVQYVPPNTPESQLEMLKQEKQYLESEMSGIKNAMEDISKRIQELEKSE